MTWIIGTPILFGYSLLIGDIRVTTRDGKTFDGVRKVAGICNSLAGGFAGNVYQGLTILEHLSAVTKLPNSPTAWLPEDHLANCPRIMKKIYEDTEKIIGEENAGVQIMIAGVHPTKNVPENMPWPLPYCYIFRSPNFIAEEIPIGKVRSIGSGAGVETYVTELENLSDFKKVGGLMKLEAVKPGQFGEILGHIVGGIAGKQLTPDVSPHLITCMISRTEMKEWPNDRGDDAMPPIASTWEELLQMAQEAGFASEDAKAFIS